MSAVTTRRALIAWACAIAAFVATPASAQVPNLGFNLFSPGARANAMGRAFIGVADDASAAISNPAGLINLTRTQVYAEMKSAEFEGLFGAETQRITSLSFLNLAAPLGARAAVAGTRHEFLNYSEVDFAIRGTSYAGSIAVMLTDSLSAGVTVSLDRISLNSVLSSTTAGVTGGGLWRANDVVSLGFMAATGQGSDDTLYIPARAGGGIAVRPHSRLLFAADLLWIDISALEFPEVEDVTELHVGGELWLTRSFFVRLGGITTPKAGNNPTSEFFRLAPQDAVTAGFGITVRSGGQVDVAILSTKEVVVSGAVRF